MNHDDESSSIEAQPLETSQMLRRILDAVEQGKRNRWLEIAAAILLSLATMSSAWCAYQSTLWGGVQTFRITAAGRAGRHASEQTIAALQYKAFDAAMFIDYIEAVHAGDKRVEAFLYQRFRPEARKAIDAWLATDPFNNPEAPLGPFRMAEYVQPEEEQIKRAQEESALMLEQAQQANQISDKYVLLTVMFASVLFFGGICGTFQSRRLRLTCGAIALLLFLVTVSVLAGMPVCQE